MTRRIIPFALFALFLSLWTWKLLEPVPVPETITGRMGAGLKFGLAKVLHVSGYAFLTILASFLPVRRPYFWMAIILLAVHGVGTEIGQTYVPNRTGSAQDVALDWLGIALGLVVCRYALASQRPPPVEPAQLW